MQKMPSTFVAHSERMKQVIETAYRVARIDTTVLILGESGVGKDLVARLIHEASPRMETGTFVKINCGAIPPDLLESELFGHEAGAFTGARKEGKAGYFEIADKGTIFLDEIGDLPLRLQVKLLSVIQDQEVTRVGGTKPKKVDARIIAATNRDVEKMVKTGTFREDLYYRLNVVPFYIPALRERREEIPFLIKHYLNEFNSRYSLKVKLTQEVVERLTAYRWPGNVRELANLVEQLVVLANEELVTVDHLPKRFSIPERNDLAETQELRPLDESVREFEMKLIRSALDQSKSNEEAAHKLGISLSTLARRLRQFKTDSHS
ncbi:MAG: Limonene hydroxylase [Syntrophorhabdus sp. PtaB.Bin047]|nr:MAG: Limonene hydroxylase [Syntrophorhabdus sp. PtaB.Bin047]